MNMMWFPIITYPEHPHNVLISDGNYVVYGYYDAQNKTWGVIGNTYRYYPTHWMPLPTPPSKD